ncbi:hypothetical protein CEK71_16465 [Methylovulum psychrotolerans]|uniref:Uncharacterized protein n=2 Tax=Methylovulum psychrotolerans TaxID=1704499 RepID=A0A1Z4C1W9_9GAMM|nr:hypothetical protein CEK71_16465 [Methylovulum psychrotolerans]
MNVKLGVLLVAIVMASPAGAQTWAVTTAIELSANSEPAKGAVLRPQMEELMGLLQGKRWDEAERLATQLRKAYEASFNQQLPHYSFRTSAEYEAFKKTASAPFEWVDWSYKQCLQMQAFIRAEKQQFAEAVALLQDVVKLAPYSADARAEMAAALNSLGRFEEALVLYKETYRLAEQYSSQQELRGMALRGMGFSLTELKRLDEAERAYRQDLEIEPTNKLALGELAYIERLRKGR